MDVQMPVMDGYTATSRIREDPRWKDLPILAMTANVMAEDRTKVAQVGMNDHVAKPIIAQELFAKLLQWVPHGQRSLPTGLGEPSPEAGADEVQLPPALPGMDLPKALMNVGGNRKLLKKLLADFAQDHGQDLPKMREALDAGDLPTAQRLAHTLKSVGGAIGAQSLQQRAGALEAALREERLQEAPALLSALHSSLQPLMNSLQTWSAALSPPVGPASASQPAAVPPPQDPQALQRLMNELQVLLQELDPEAAERAQILASHFPPDQVLAQNVAQQARDFDFESALQSLQALRNTLS